MRDLVRRKQPRNRSRGALPRRLRVWGMQGVMQEALRHRSRAFEGCFPWYNVLRALMTRRLRGSMRSQQEAPSTSSLLAFAHEQQW